MDEARMEVLMNLCREIYLVVDLEPNEDLGYHLELFEQEIYKFYIDVDQENEVESIKIHCDRLRNHFVLFILTIKQAHVSRFKSESIIEHILAITSNLIDFIEHLAKKSDENTLLFSINQLIALIKQSDSQEFIKNYAAGEILKEKSYLENLISDINYISTDVSNESKQIINKQIEIYEQIAAKILFEDQKNPDHILITCKKISKDLGYLVACVRAIQIISLDTPPIPEELEEINKIISQVKTQSNNIIIEL
jgi:hypothetical protein